MKIITDRLNLRNIHEMDENDITDIYSNEKVCEYLLHEAWTHENRKEKFQEELSKHDLFGKDGLNIIVDLEDKAIGLLTVWHTEMRETLEIGFSFSPEFTGKGYATESVTALFDYLFSQFQIHRIQANCDARNQASAGLCKRAGMRQEAHFIKDFWNKGEWTDSLIFAILKEEHMKENKNQY